MHKICASDISYRQNAEFLKGFFGEFLECLEGRFCLLGSHWLTSRQGGIGFPLDCTDDHPIDTNLSYQGGGRDCMALVSAFSLFPIPPLPKWGGKPEEG